MGFGGSGGGSNNIYGSTDVALSSPANNEVLTYDTNISKWKNAAGGGGVTQGALDLKAPLASPALTGNPTAPTPTAGDKDTSISTTAFVSNAIQTDAQVTVRWSGSAWGSRPASAPFGVLFLSTNDANATAPSDINLASGDIWRRHPNAV